MDINLTPFRGVKHKPFRRISIDTTYFRLPAFRPCLTCGKVGEIISGLPKKLEVSIPMTDEEFKAVAGIKPFYICGDFEVTCYSGYSHVAKGTSPSKKWIISTDIDPTKGYAVEGEGFESTLARFIPEFAKWLK